MASPLGIVYLLGSSPSQPPSSAASVLFLTLSIMQMDISHSADVGFLRLLTLPPEILLYICKFHLLNSNTSRSCYMLLNDHWFALNSIIPRPPRPPYSLVPLRCLRKTNRGSRAPSNSTLSCRSLKSRSFSRTMPSNLWRPGSQKRRARSWTRTQMEIRWLSLFPAGNIYISLLPATKLILLCILMFLHSP